MIPLFINVPIFMLEDRRRSAPTEIQARKYDNLAITGLVLSGFGIMAFAVLGIFNRVFYLILRTFEINALLSNILSLSPVLAALLTNFLGYSICTYVIWMNITKRKGNTRVLVLSGIGVLISLCLFSAIAFVMYFSLQMISYW